MKETINVNIAQQAFTMDIDAYAALTSYLDDIGRRLPSDDADTLPDIAHSLQTVLVLWPEEIFRGIVMETL